MTDPNTDSRVFDRRPVTVLTTCKPTFAGQICSVTLRNLSRGGLGLLATKQFDVGTRLVIDVRGNLKIVSVAHIRKEGKQWYLGCRFVGRLTDAEFAALLGPDDDLRRVQRQPLTLVTTCRLSSAAETFAATIQNISREGVGLLAAMPLDVGETVAIELQTGMKIALVSFARREEEQELWLIGFRFVGSLTPEELASVVANSPP